MQNTFRIEDEFLNNFGVVKSSHEIANTPEKNQIKEAYIYAMRRMSEYSFRSMNDPQQLSHAREFRIVAEVLGAILLHSEDKNLLHELRCNALAGIEGLSYRFEHSKNANA